MYSSNHLIRYASRRRISLTAMRMFRWQDIDSLAHDYGSNTIHWPRLSASIPLKISMHLILILLMYYDGYVYDAYGRIAAASI